MKHKLGTILLTLALVVGLTGSAFAGNGSFNLSEDSTIEGKELRAGRYQAAWNENGEVWLTAENGAQFKVQGKVVERATKASRTSILQENNLARANRVLEVRFGGKKTVLVFGEAKVAQKQ